MREKKLCCRLVAAGWLFGLLVVVEGNGMVTGY